MFEYSATFADLYPGPFKRRTINLTPVSYTILHSNDNVLFKNKKLVSPVDSIIISILILQGKLGMAGPSWVRAPQTPSGLPYPSCGPDSKSLMGLLLGGCGRSMSAESECTPFLPVQKQGRIHGIRRSKKAEKQKRDKTGDGPADGPTDRRTHNHIEMRGRI